MAKKLIKSRFAPSPTGLLHLGNVRVALFCALFARSTRGIFLLRIEDTDRARGAEHYVQALQEDLRWLGLDWQEGFGAGGPHGPYAQSQRGAVYQGYYDQLENNGQAYPCFCSEQALELSRKAQAARGQPPRYAGTCAVLTDEEISFKRAEGLQPALRFRVLPGQTLQFDDLVRGPQSFASGDIGDFIIRRADGTPAFLFSNAIDDGLMEVSHILRGEDHLSNTPRQILLLQALSLPVPCYGHASLITGEDGAPLSKRHGALSVRELRESGYLPGAIVNYLARLGHYYEDNSFMSFGQLATAFSLDKIGRAPARFDKAQLDHRQQEAIALVAVGILWDWMGGEVHELVPLSKRSAFIEAIRHNITVPEQACLWARILYTDPLQLSEDALKVVEQAGSGFFEQAHAAFDRHQSDFKAWADEIKGNTGVRGKALFQPLRAALTGKLDGPEMTHLLPLLDALRARGRLRAAMQSCAQG